MTERWFEDFTPGLVVESGGATVTETQILDFALAWDPQPFHIDTEAAVESPYGGLIASGFHTLALTFRLLLPELGVRRSSIGAPGIEHLAWKAPVRPGDTLRGRMTVLESRPSRSKPDRGAAICESTTLNQRDEAVMVYRYAHLLLKRHA